jgi:hypothetical protein
LPVLTDIEAEALVARELGKFRRGMPYFNRVRVPLGHPEKALLWFAYWARVNFWIATPILAFMAYSGLSLIGQYPGSVLGMCSVGLAILCAAFVSWRTARIVTTTSFLLGILPTRDPESEQAVRSSSEPA